MKNIILFICACFVSPLFAGAGDPFSPSYVQPIDIGDGVIVFMEAPPGGLYVRKPKPLTEEQQALVKEFHMTPWDARDYTKWKGNPKKAKAFAKLQKKYETTEEQKVLLKEYKMSLEDARNYTKWKGNPKKAKAFAKLQKKYKIQ